VAAAARAELAGFLRDQRIELAPSATLEELGRTVESRLAVDAAPFVAAASEARYGAPAHAAAAAGRTRAELRLLLRGLRGVLPLRRRLLGYLSLRSLRLGGP